METAYEGNVVGVYYGHNFEKTQVMLVTEYFYT